MLNVLGTGGAGFIGRWVVKQQLNNGHKVWVLDDLPMELMKILKTLEPIRILLSLSKEISKVLIF